MNVSRQIAVTVRAKAGIQISVSKKTGNQAGTGGYQCAIGLFDDRRRPQGSAGIEYCKTICSKIGIQGTVCSITNKSKTGPYLCGDYQFTIGLLYKLLTPFLVAITTVGNDHTICTEAVVETAIDVEAEQHNVVTGVRPNVTEYDNFIIRLLYDVSKTVGRADINREFAVTTKAGIKRAILVVTNQGKIIVITVITDTGHNDLAVRLHQHGTRFLVKVVV